MPDGTTETAIRRALTVSGYPLQSVIANYLKRRYRIVHEWGYLDDESGDLRTLDLLAEKHLFDTSTVSDLKVRPQLSLLIECKQSTLPYVFFQIDGSPWLPYYPAIAGLHEPDVAFKNRNGEPILGFSLMHALELDKHSFLKQAPYCATLSKCVRKGKDLELSGSEPYMSLMQPLTKSKRHFINVRKPSSIAKYFDLYLSLAIAILDAPMLAVKVQNESASLSLVPWVRVIKREYTPANDRFRREETQVVDVVHKDFFSRYLQRHVAPFAARFADLVFKHADKIATGRPFHEGMTEAEVDAFEKRFAEVDQQDHRGYLGRSL